MASKTNLESSFIEQVNGNSEYNSTGSKKIFIPAIGTLGDVKPFLILAKELEKRGYIVWLGVHKRFQDMVKAAGIHAIEIGGDMEAILSTTPEGIELRRNPSLFKIAQLKHVYSLMIEEWFHDILSVLKDVDLLVLSIGSFVAGLSCVEKFPNIKTVTIFTFPFLRTSEFSPPGIGGKSESLFGWINLMKWKMFNYAAFSLHNDKVNQLRATIGLPPIKCTYEQMIRSVPQKPMKTATIYSKYLVSCPSDWESNDIMVGPILDKDYQDFEPPTHVLDFLKTWVNEKIIFVSMGSMMSVMLDIDEQMQFLNNITLALENNNCKAIISLIGFQQAPSNQLSSTGDLLYLAQSIPHSWLFQSISGVVHHGGAGTTHTGLVYGLPTLILPFGADQPFNADRVYINKLGPRCIPIRQTNAKNLTQAIRDLMHDNYNLYVMNTKKIGELIKNEDGLGQCIRLIETELEA